MVNLDKVKLDVSVILGETKDTLSNIICYEEGKIIDLHLPISTKSKMYINNKKIAKGEIMCNKGKMAFRIKEFEKSII